MFLSAAVFLFVARFVHFQFDRHELKRKAFRAGYETGLNHGAEMLLKFKIATSVPSWHTAGLHVTATVNAASWEKVGL